MKYNTSQLGLIDEFATEHAVDMVTISKVWDVYTSHRTTVIRLWVMWVESQKNLLQLQLTY